jgi:23S rRNA (guanosine2251-2'-O)-methyltransferase
VKEWITGRNPVYESLSARRRHFFQLLINQGAEPKGRLLDSIKLAQKYKIPVLKTDRRQLDSINPKNQGLALQASAYPYRPLQDILNEAESQNEPLFVLMLDVIQDPQNLGTLIRTAEAVGVHGIVIPQARAAAVTPAVVNASSGASEHMIISQGNLSQAITKLKESGAWVMGLEGSPDAQPIEKIQMDGPLVLIVGSEGEGLRALTRKSCDVLLSLPLRGKIESLNAAVAGSVALYTALQARLKS